MVFTLDFLVGLFVNIPLLIMIDSYCRRDSYRSSNTTTIVFLLVLCIVFGFFKNKLIPRKWRAPFQLPISSGWIVACSIVMAVFIALYSTLEYHISFNRMTDVVLPVCWLFGVFLMIVSNSARVPWVVLTNICLLGLLVYNVSNDGDRGGGYDGVDAYYDPNLPDDSIWANFSIDTPVVDATPDIGITDFAIPGADNTGMMFPGSDLAMATAPAFTPLDTWGSFDLADTSFATEVPQFANDPYMALGTGAAFNDNFQICDANGMPELTIADGNIFNSENVIVGHINYDPTLHMTTYTDTANMPYMYIDQANNIYTGDGCLMGRLSDSGNTRTIFDAKGGIPYQIDKLTNTIFDAKTGSIIGKIKNS